MFSNNLVKRLFIFVVITLTILPVIGCNKIVEPAGNILELAKTFYFKPYNLEKEMFDYLTTSIFSKKLRAKEIEIDRVIEFYLKI